MVKNAAGRQGRFQEQERRTARQLLSIQPAETNARNFTKHLRLSQSLQQTDAASGVASGLASGVAVRSSAAHAGTA
jgi:hypothetical protein